MSKWTMDRSICYSSLFIQAYTRNVSNMVSVCVCERVLCMGWIQVAKIQSKREQNIEREKPVLQILRTSNYTYIHSTEPRIG